MKRPSFQFYPGDWLNDAALRMVSVGARGLWIDMISFMHQGSEYGYLKVNGKVILPSNLARMVGATLDEIEGWLSELKEVAVYSMDDQGCIFSRRMIRDEEIRKARAAGGSKGGNPNLIGGKKDNFHSNLPATPSSSSSSSSSKPKPKAPSGLDGEFDEFWKAYPAGCRGKPGKGAAKKAWEKHKPNLQIVLKALKWQSKSEAWTKDAGQFIPNPATYLNQQRWEDEPITQEVAMLTEKPWFLSWSKTEEKAKELGLTMTRDEQPHQFLNRVLRAAEVTPEMFNKAKSAWENK